MTIKEMKEKKLLLLECVSGSRAFGLDMPSSDTDIRGVYYLPAEQFYGLEYIPQVNDEKNNEVYYELGRFVTLLIRNNPNMLELLATPGEFILYRHPLMEQLDISVFLSKLCRDTFAGYAMTQIRKAQGLKKKMMNPVAKERKSVLDCCFIIDGHISVALQDWLAENNLDQNACGLLNIAHASGLYALFYDAAGTLHYSGIVSSVAANEVSLSAIPKNEKAIAYLFFNKEHYSSYCKEYLEYQNWLDERNEERYGSNKAHGKNYDAKNMMHTIRLLQVADEIAVTGRLQLKRPNRQELLDIKAGGLEYGQLMEMADQLMLQIEQHYMQSTLPERPDEQRAKEILIKMRRQLYQQPITRQ